MNFDMVIAELLARDSASVMMILAAYIGDYLCYESFCESIPPENYILLKEGLVSNPDFCTALKKSGVIASGVRRYIQVALGDYNMFYHFLDGLSVILSDVELTGMIPIRERNLIRGAFKLWKEGEATEKTWDGMLDVLHRTA